MRTKHLDSKLNYEEPLGHYLWRKGSLVVPIFIAVIFILPLSAIGILCHLSGVLCNIISSDDIVTLLAMVASCVLLLIMLFMFSVGMQRVRIYEDRIVLPLPKRALASPGVIRRSSILIRTDIRNAELDILSEDGEKFRMKMKNLSNFGKPGDWRLRLYLVNGKKDEWTWYQLLGGHVDSKEEGLIALKSFLEGVPTEFLAKAEHRDKKVIFENLKKLVQSDVRLDLSVVRSFILLGLILLAVGVLFLLALVSMLFESGSGASSGAAALLVGFGVFTAIGVGLLVIGRRQFRRIRMIQRRLGLQK